MKFRTCLLVVCMVVVPLIAMFSHRMPPGTLAAVGTRLRDLAGGARREAEPTSETAAVRPRAVDPPPTEPVSPERSGDVAGRGTATVSRITEAASLDQLRRLGAVAIDCRPLRGGRDHVATCRFPVDGAGELERVFQAVGHDAATAADKLLHEVITASRRPVDGTRPAAMRF